MAGTPTAFDSDVPYILKTVAGPITAMPFTMEVNDMPLYIRYGNEPAAFTHVLEKIVSNWASIGNHPGCLDITIHAHVFGRPYGLIEFRNAIAFAAGPRASGSVTMQPWRRCMGQDRPLRPDCGRLTSTA